MLWIVIHMSLKTIFYDFFIFLVSILWFSRHFNCIEEHLRETFKGTFRSVSIIFISDGIGLKKKQNEKFTVRLDELVRRNRQCRQCGRLRGTFHREATGPNVGQYAGRARVAMQNCWFEYRK